MCRGGRMIADFVAGTDAAPDVPEVVASSLTSTIDGEWVVWAQKVARSSKRNRFTPLTGGDPYPIDAVAECRAGRDHDAPEPFCSPPCDGGP
jgi:hypothetical protein